MKISALGLKLVKDFEGCKLRAYLCPAGKWTIGWGHTGPEVTAGLVWTQQQADDALVADLATAEKTVNTSVRVKLTQPQFDALVVFTFNVGVSAFANSTMRKFLNLNDFVGAALQFKRWNKVTVDGKLEESKGLTRRRWAEQKRFETKELP